MVVVLVLIFMAMGVVVVVLVLTFMAMGVVVVVLMLTFMAMGVVVVVLMLIFMAMGMVVVVKVLVLLRSVDGDLHMGAADAAGDGGGRLQMNAGQAQAVHGGQEALLVLQQLVQGGHEHIPRRAHVTFNI